MRETGSTKTYLLTWNPKNWPWKEQQVVIGKVVATGTADDSWSIGNRKSMPVGSRFYLIRLGDEGRGIIGSGYTGGEPYEGPHWDTTRRGAKANFVSITFDALQEFPRISWEDLQSEPFSSFPWGSRSSGIEIPDDIAVSLESLWKNVSNASIFAELPNTAKDYPEGSVRAVLVNAYERNDKARNECIAKHGRTCHICGEAMGDKYGPIAAFLIHVHHLLPLSKIRKNYNVKPETDLVPLCPSCHAVVHLKDPPLTLSQVKKMIQMAKNN
jgi:5-methylcytosine-specific restriction protein A